MCINITLKTLIPSQDQENLGDDFPKLGYRFLPARQEVPPHEDEAKVYRMFFFRVNSSALVGLTDCTNKNKNKYVRAHADQ